MLLARSSSRTFLLHFVGIVGCMAVIILADHVTSTVSCGRNNDCEACVSQQGCVWSKDDSAAISTCLDWDQNSTSVSSLFSVSLEDCPSANRPTPNIFRHRTKKLPKEDNNNLNIFRYDSVTEVATS